MALRLSRLPPLPDWKDGLVRLVNALASRGGAGVTQRKQS